MIWLGDRSGYLSDWVTQQWVRWTGRRISLLDVPWLDGPAGNTLIIGKNFFADYARDHGLEIVQSGCRGLLADFRELSSNRNDPGVIAPAVSNFYERTSEYELDAWSEWNGLFKPFGTALGLIFSRRLQRMFLCHRWTAAEEWWQSRCGIRKAAMLFKQRGYANYTQPRMLSMPGAIRYAVCRAIRVRA